jgi:hypothetical protein
MPETKGFKHPTEMQAPEERTPVSARVKIKTKAVLEREAKKGGLSVGTVISNVLDEYAEWLLEHPEKSKKSS